MALVEALTGFDHYGPRRRGDRFTVGEPMARKLRDKGLVQFVEGDGKHPPVAAGNPSSASPVARHSTRKTASKSAGGEKPRRKRAKQEAS